MPQTPTARGSAARPEAPSGRTAGRAHGRSEETLRSGREFVCSATWSLGVVLVDRGRVAIDSPTWPGYEVRSGRGSSRAISSQLEEGACGASTSTMRPGRRRGPFRRHAPRPGAPRSERPWAGGGAGGRAAAALAGGPVPRGSDGWRRGSRGAPSVALARLKRADRGARDDEHARVRAGVAEPVTTNVERPGSSPSTRRRPPTSSAGATATNDNHS